jgi:hypothetical protein
MPFIMALILELLLSFVQNSLGNIFLDIIGGGLTQQ